MVSMNLRKRAYVRRERVVAQVPERVEGRTPYAAAEFSAALAQARRAIESMKPDLRIVFTLYEVEEMRMKDIAEMLSVPLQTAYTRLYRAREVFAKATKGINHE
jgi:RNA polymerase sigma-70 factor (ECF subfamily)